MHWIEDCSPLPVFQAIALLKNPKFCPSLFHCLFIAVNEDGILGNNFYVTIIWKILDSRVKSDVEGSSFVAYQVVN